MTAPDFVHLDVHSHLSLLSATCRIEDLVAAAVKDGQKALALTDDGNLFGAIELYQACRDAGIKAILGMTAFCAAGSRLAPSGPDNPTYPLILLAENGEGWSNLKRLSSLGFLEGFHYRPRIDRELLARHGRGLIALLGGLQSEAGQHLLAGREAQARQAVAEARELLGREHCFLEVQHTGYEPQARVTEALLRLGAELDVPIVATNEVRYPAAEDWIAHDIQLAIRAGKTISDQDRFRMGSRELWFKDRTTMARAFVERPDALAASVAIAERCAVQIDFHTYHLPVFDTGSDETPDAMFERLCREGARDRYGNPGPEVEARLTHEIAVVRKLGFVSYFLIVSDFIRHARAQHIPVGPGRGSAAGSIVAYCLRITDLDPLRYSLIFERFLNADRISMPDIDVDFCGSRRDEVIDYVRAKYGRDNVSQIITFGTMASRGVLRDVGRVLEVPLGEIDKIAKKIPSGPGASLEKALESDPEVAEVARSSPEMKRLFDLGVKLEGLARHSSVHAAGVVVADRPLIEHVPLARNGDDITTQWQMTELEEVGLLKVDFLGLKTLTILEEAVRLVQAGHGIALELDRLDLADRPTYELMTHGDTLGVFQLESEGMRELLGRLRPDTFEDVIAVLALYRPGPLNSGMVDMFVRRKHGEEKVAYPHDSLRPLLEETYGVIVYQEQVMRIANVLAGFSMNQADALRKAMGKKKPEVMAKFKEQFIDGAVRNGHERKFAKELFETIEFFAGYGFNKSHSAAYAVLTYQTAWLKAHWPVEFLAANLTVEAGNSDKVKELVDEARRLQIGVLPPDVNQSQARFGVEAGAVRFGLCAVKGVGERTALAIGQSRAAEGPYRSLEDLCERLDPAVANKIALEALARAGAFDALGAPRRTTLAAVDGAMRAAALARDERRKGQKLLFGLQAAVERTAPRAQAEEWTAAERLAQEKEALGFYLSGHPFHKRGRLYARLAGFTSASVRTLPAGSEVRVAGMIAGIRLSQVKSGPNTGQKMARFRLEDLEGSLPVTCFTKVYQQLRGQVVEDALVFARGRIDRDGEEVGMLLDELSPAQAVIDAEVHALVLRLREEQVLDRTLAGIAEALEQSRGEHRLLFEVQQGDDLIRVRANPRYSLRLTSELLDRLADLLGPASLAFTRNARGARR